MTNPKPPIEVEKILYDFEQKSHTARIEALSELGTTKNLLNAKKEALAALNRAYGEQMLGLIEDYWRSDSVEDPIILNLKETINKQFLGDK